MNKIDKSFWTGCWGPSISLESRIAGAHGQPNMTSRGNQSFPTLRELACRDCGARRLSYASQGVHHPWQRGRKWKWISRRSTK